MSRKNLSQKNRFEVLKRDSFTCQYCGRAAPKVLLEVDHINPVYEGGTNDIMNLITSCVDCNRGKTKNKLSDDSAITAQKDTLDMLEAKRQQIESMFEWSQSLKEVNNLKTDKCIEYFRNKFSKIDIIKYLDRTFFTKITKGYSIEEIIEAIDIGVDSYTRIAEKSIQEKLNENRHHYKWAVIGLEKLIIKRDRCSEQEVLDLENKLADIQKEVFLLKDKIGKTSSEEEIKILKKYLSSLNGKSGALSNQLSAKRWTSINENEKVLLEERVASLQREFDVYNSLNTLEYNCFLLLIKKLSGILRNKKRELEDPEYITILSIYKWIRNNTKYKEFRFCFKNIEKYYTALRQKNFNQKDCYCIMTQRVWDSFDEFDETISDIKK